MGFWARLWTNTELMNRMFDKTGAMENVVIGESTGRALQGAAFRCASCNSVEECRHWLETETPEISGAHPAAPSFCANAELIERWRSMA